MGLIYGYDIYLRPRHVARALANLAELAPPAHAVPPLEITLPGGNRLVLPFTSRFKSDPVDCSTSSALELDTSLMFDVDDALHEYAQTGGRGPEADGRIQIGYIYATIRFESLPHPGYASMECWAAMSGMNCLFALSANVRKAFREPGATSSSAMSPSSGARTVPTRLRAIAHSRHSRPGRRQLGLDAIGFLTQPSTRRRAASSCCSSSPTTDGIRHLPGSDDTARHHSRRITDPMPDQ
ncbi:hypothetical protein AB0I77_51005 [Streptomyces sp. NPDC050619]|uniref:hypothetical protein n=1 Tax=Streptomyces sp. NPDC050619 TaxID=3157214 RepID=UPI0034423532